jgi:hypothetical protein
MANQTYCQATYNFFLQKFRLSVKSSPPIPLAISSMEKSSVQKKKGAAGEMK